MNADGFSSKTNHFGENIMVDWTGQSLFGLLIHRCENEEDRQGPLPPAWRFTDAGCVLPARKV